MGDQDIHRRRKQIVLGITGSVAAIKGPELALALWKELDADVRILLTRGGENFWDKANSYDPISWKELHRVMTFDDPKEIDEEKKSCGDASTANENGDCDDTKRGKITLHYAQDEWAQWNELGDPVQHIDLRDWADLLIVAPLSAHTLAKIANGLCDDALSCTIRAWDFGHGIRPGKPMILAPAMNTAMWVHPLTSLQLKTIQSFWKGPPQKENGIYIVEPQVKTLACGEVGSGALAKVHDIVMSAKNCLKHSMNETV